MVSAWPVRRCTANCTRTAGACRQQSERSLEGLPAAVWGRHSIRTPSPPSACGRHGESVPWSDGCHPDAPYTTLAGPARPTCALTPFCRVCNSRDPSIPTPRCCSLVAQSRPAQAAPGQGGREPVVPGTLHRLPVPRRYPYRAALHRGGAGTGGDRDRRQRRSGRPGVAPCRLPPASAALPAYLRRLTNCPRLTDQDSTLERGFCIYSQPLNYHHHHHHQSQTEV